MASANQDVVVGKKISQCVSVVLGAQWGDEGKGKIVDMLARNVDIVCRCQGGNNAGHTVVVDDKTYDFHLLPSGIIHKNCEALIGNGVVVHLPSLFAEIEKNKEALGDWQRRFILSDRAHLVFDVHQMVDGMQETERAEEKIGTTKKGIGPAYSTKCSYLRGSAPMGGGRGQYLHAIPIEIQLGQHWRSGIRVSDLIGDFGAFSEKFKKLVASYTKQFSLLNVDVENELKIYKALATKLRSLDIVRDTVSYLNAALKCTPAKQILVEGANGVLLDIDFGTYPYVTSSNCSVGGVLTGLGVPPQSLGEIIGVVKAYQTRVGDGPFPTELSNEIGEKLRKVGHEFGVTTGRPRRCGWLDLVLLKYSHNINGYTSLALTKIDVLDDFDEIKVAVNYKLDGQQINYMPANLKDFERLEIVYVTFTGWKTNTSEIRKFEHLPENARHYVQSIQEIVGVPIRWIGIGQDRKALITMF